MFKLNLKIALRTLWKSKGYTLINVGGLAIGLASCMLLLLYVAYEWGYDKQFSDYEKTYVVYNNQAASGKIFSFDATPGVLAAEVKTKIPGVKTVARMFYEQERLISLKDNNFKRLCNFADPAFFQIFDYKVLKGNPASFLKSPQSVVLTETLAKALFGDEDPMGKSLKFDNAEELKVEGVIVDPPKNSSNQFEYLMSWTLFEKLNPWAKDHSWGGNYCHTFIQLEDNRFFEQANTQLQGMIKANNKDSNGEPFMHPLSKYHLYDNFEGGKSVGGKIDQLQIFVLLAFCILIIACVNFMNLSTARSEKRAKEVGVRKSIGSSRKDLIGQFMMESVLISMLSMVVAFMLIEVALPYFNRLLGIELDIDYTYWLFWTTLMGLTLITGVIAGSYPAFYLSSFDPIKVLKGFTSTGAGGSSLSVRKFLVVFQFVFAACLIICTAVIYQQLNYIVNKPIGYNINNLVEVPVQGALREPGKFQVIKDQLLKTGMVSAVTNYSTKFTDGGNNGYSVSWPGSNPDENVLVNFRWTNYDFSKTTGIQLLQGRDFDPQFADSSNVIINEALAKVMDLKQPLGAVINFGDAPVTIIGIIKDYVVESPYMPATPMIIGFTKDANEVILVRVADHANLTASLHAIDQQFEALNPGFPVDRRFIDDNFQKKFRNEKLLGTLANWFGGFAIFISCLGLLGLALYMAEQRKKEISIRKVLGANSANILVLLNKDFIKLVLIANMIAFPLGYVIVSKWLSHFEFRISISVLPFALALLLSLVIAILTVSLQSFKVAKANPIDALKYE
ncbi:ABC transporter permease [Pedobacter sp. SAFR-022]|uniref:ABC transporter permease n=1 Tax=Pedobacter sp. SAFR-022 TaxID=3436861 RepID=UPI003F7F9B93